MIILLLLLFYYYYYLINIILLFYFHCSVADMVLLKLLRMIQLFGSISILYYFKKIFFMYCYVSQRHSLAMWTVKRGERTCS